MGNISRSIKDLTAEIEELPERFDSAEQFIDKVESLDREIRVLEKEISDKKLEKAILEGDAPETSSEELQKMVEEAVSNFERIHHEGETLAKVRDRTMSLLESMDANTYSSLEKVSCTVFNEWLADGLKPLKWTLICLLRLKRMTGVR